MTPERILAALIVAVCAALLLRLVLGEKRRARLDAALRRAVRSVRSLAMSARHRREAARAADEAIERARQRSGEWDGNVYKPKSFRKPPRDKMH